MTTPAQCSRHSLFASLYFLGQISIPSHTNLSYISHEHITNPASTLKEVGEKTTPKCTSILVRTQNRLMRLKSVPNVEEHVPHRLVDQLVQHLQLYLHAQRVSVNAERAVPWRRAQVTVDQPVHGDRRRVARRL
jgi:hypothetical protein